MKIFAVLLAIATAQNETTTAVPEPVETTTVPQPVTTTTTVEPVTTTAEPVVTTTGAPEPVTTTTAAPVPETTTPKVITTTPAPQPVTTAAPAPSDNGIRKLIGSNGTACLMVKYEASFTNTTTTFLSNSSSVVTSDSQCIEDGEGKIVLSNDSKNLIQFDLSATTVAEGTKNITTWQIQKISVTTDAGKLETVDLRAESIHGGVAYSCITGFTANLTDGTNSTDLPTLTIADFWVEVALGEDFPITDDEKFAKAESCAADIEESLLVPIVVACALAGLVLAICVAYIIGRRRTYSGYSAM